MDDHRVAKPLRQFAAITEKQIRRGSFRSTRELEQAIHTFRRSAQRSTQAVRPDQKRRRYPQLHRQILWTN
jgi:hypothetical protein